MELRNLFADRKRNFVLLTWFLITISSIAFERINDDEVAYFLESRYIASTGPIVHAHLVFVPQLLGAVALVICNNLIAARSISALAVLLTAILIYNTARDDASFAASMLYLTSFYTIRFGLRFYLDPFGGLFTIATIYFLTRKRSELVGTFSALASFSRETAAPLFPIYAVMVYRSKMSFWKFVTSFGIVAALGVVWVYLSLHTLQSAVSFNATGLASAYYLSMSSLTSVVRAWIEYIIISPLVVLGLVLARGGTKTNAFLPMISYFVITCFVPGFVINGSATEYPYIFNTIACLIAGPGVIIAYRKLLPKSKAVLKVLVALLLVQFAAQSYFATAFSVNGAIGVQDYGYWYDQGLLNYLDTHYNGGKIYGSNLDGLLDQKLAPNWVWIPQNVTRALVDNPPWLVTYTSYVLIRASPPEVTTTVIGPYLIIYRGNISLSSFIESSNRTGLLGR
jgi:hypothetical protein